MENQRELDESLKTGHDRHEAGDQCGALECFARAVAIDSACVEAHAARAALLLEMERPDEAAAAFARAAALDSASAAYRHGRAEALARAGRPDEAAGALRAFLGERPGSGRTLALLAAMEEQAGNLALARDACRDAVFAGADDPATLLLSARLALALGEVPEAVALLQRCLRADPELVEAHSILAAAFERIGEIEPAARHLRRCLELDPGDSGGFVGRLSRLGTADSLPPDYVRCLFDQYAGRFDRHLLDVLGYRGHLLLRDAAARLEAGGDVLDLGCGTGLAGAALRSRARRLAGVDLSPRMIEKARALEIYDSLEIAEVTAALDASRAAWDLILAADVLGYLGELGPAFRAVAAALRPGGLFLATVEELAGGNAPALRPTRRFAHPAGHVRERAAAAGLSIALFESATLRQEKGTPVKGLVFALRRPPG